MLFRERLIRDWPFSGDTTGVVIAMKDSKESVQSPLCLVLYSCFSIKGFEAFIETDVDPKGVRVH